MATISRPTPLHYATCGRHDGIAAQLGPLHYFMPAMDLGVYIVAYDAPLVVRGEVLEPQRTHLAEEFAKRLYQTGGGKQ